jgi:hypothetical protein
LWYRICEAEIQRGEASPKAFAKRTTSATDWRTQHKFEAYHHLVNPLSLECWQEALEQAASESVEYIPIMPETTSRLFLSRDHLWHVKKSNGEVGDELHPDLGGLPGFPGALQQILYGILQMETQLTVGSGLVFWARRRRV